MTAPVKAICLTEGDDVANVLAPVAAGQTVHVDGCGRSLDLSATVALKIYHKIALRNLAAGETIRRDGYVIGSALCDIAAGDWVHIHNLRSLRARAKAGAENV